MALEREVQQYRINLLNLLGPDGENEGKFTVIKDDVIDGPFDTYKQALKFAYDHHGLDSFLVKKIERNESVMYFSRELR